MGFWDVFEGIKRWSWIVAAVTFCSVIIAIFISCFLIDTIYEAKTTILINLESYDNKNDSSFQSDESVLKSYSTLLYSDLVLNKTIKDLRINIDIDKFRSLIKVENVQDSGFIKITAGDNKPKVARDIANTLVKNLQSEANNINLVGTMIVIDKAVAPVSPERPNLFLNIFISAIAGLMVGITLIFILENIDDSVKSSVASIKNQNIPIIGMVPEFQKSIMKDQKSGIVAQKDKAYQTIRSKINFLCSGNSYQVILVTSMGFSEGKTLTAVNMAISLGQIGKKVLLIDCNLRSPNIHTVFGLENEKGITWQLTHNDEKSYDVHSTQETNLDVIVCGQLPENPAELLESEALTRIIEFGRLNYDLVVIDSAPILPFDDTHIIARQADATVLVVNYRKTKIPFLKNNYDRLQNSGMKILGVILNKIRYQEKSD